MVAVRCKGKVDFKSQKETSEPLLLFDLESMGVQESCFLEETRKSFDDLEWDYYDVRREQLAIILSALAPETDFNSHFQKYYSGSLSLKDLLTKLPALNPETVEGLLLIKPYRRRATSQFELEWKDKGKDTWKISRLSNQGLTQQVAPSDYRSMPRSFKETAIQVVEHPEFVRLLQAIGAMVRQVDNKAAMMTLTCWQTGIVATTERAGSNSPEGIHQDGADYIVSALVTERDNVKGGTSRVFAPDKRTEHLEVTLQKGQGIFQADTGSSLWHDVTPVSIDNPSEGQGVRNIFGFDIRVTGRKQ